MENGDVGGNVELVTE